MPDHRHEPGHRGPAGHRADDDARGRHAVRRAVLVRARAAQELRRGLRPDDVDRPPLAALAGPRRVPRPPLAHLPAAQRADAQGPVLRAHRRDHGRGHHLAARDARAASATGTTATPGSATPRSRSGACTRWASTGRPTTSSTSSPTWPRRRRASCRSCTASTASPSWWRRSWTTSPATRARARCGSATAPTTRTSTTSGARCWTRFYLHTKSRDHLPERIWPILKKQVEDAIEHWKEPDQGIWEVRGEPKHFTSSKLMCWVALDRGARLAEIREEKELAEEWQKVADEIHDDICENALDDRGVFCQHYDTDALDASVLLMPLVRFLDPEDERIRATVLAIADELTAGRPGAALPHRRDRRRPLRRGGHVHDLLVLAGVGAGGDRRAGPRPRAVREAAVLLVARCSCTPRRSTRARAATWATSRRRSPTWP